jgi:hypothetical protein
VRAHFPGLCHQFTSDALWSPRSPRRIDAAHDWRTLPPGTAGSSVPAFPFAQSSSVPTASCIARVRVVDAAFPLRAGLPSPVPCLLFPACTEPPRPPPRHKLTVQPLEGRASVPLVAAMECGRVGQTFLSALEDARRQECPCHIGRGSYRTSAQAQVGRRRPG